MLTFKLYSVPIATTHVYDTQIIIQAQVIFKGGFIRRNLGVRNLHDFFVGNVLN